MILFKQVTYKNWIRFMVKKTNIFQDPDKILPLLEEIMRLKQLF